MFYKGLKYVPSCFFPVFFTLLKKQLGQSVRLEQKKKASAWYLATYDRKYSPKLELQNETKIDKKSAKKLETDLEKLKLEKEETKESEEQEPQVDFLLSFPWVVYDILCEIKNERNTPIH